MSLLPHTDYFYDLTGSNAYILLNSDSERLRKVIDFLQEHDVVCTGSGASRYPSRSGKQYQWFIRVTDEEGAKPDSNVIHALLRQFNDSPDVDLLNNQFAQLKTKLDDQVKKNRVLAAERERVAKESKSQAEALKLQADALRERLARASTEGKSQLEALESQVTGLHKQVAALNEEIERYEQQQQVLEHKLKEADELFNTFSKDFSDLEGRYRILDQLYVSVCSDRDNLSTQLSEIGERDRFVELPPAGTQGVALVILEWLKPNVEFLKDSIELITKRLDPEPILERIRCIVVGKQHAPSVKGAKGWSELHFSTGQDDTGRIYFCVKNKKSYIILISFKENQDKDIAYLRTV